MPFHHKPDIRLTFAAAAIAILFSFLAAFGQPAWVKTAANEAKDKRFDPDATSAVLYRSADYQISEKFKCKIQVRVAYQVLTPAGQSEVVLSEAGSKSLSVSNISGWNILPDGRIFELQKSDIFKVGIFEDYAYYGDSFNIVAVPQKIETGSIVAYEYDLEESGLSSLFQEFTVQVQRPVVFTSINFSVPKGWQLKVTGNNLGPIKIEESVEGLHLTARDLPYQPAEPFMPPWSYLARRIFVVAVDPNPQNPSSIRSWQDVANWYRSLIQDAGNRDTDLTRATQTLIRNYKTPGEKIEAISRFVQEKIRYVAVELGKGAYQPRAAAETFVNRYGDCKDKSLLLCTMLNSAGIEAIPALAITAGVIKEELPTPSQFNHVIVAIPGQALDGDYTAEQAFVANWLFIDPTDPAIQVGDLPNSLQGSHVLPVCAAGAELVELPYGEANHFAREFSADANLRTDGSLSATVAIKSFGNIAQEARYTNQFLTLDEQIENWQDFLSATIPNARISDFTAGDAADTSWVRFRITGSDLLLKNGDYLLLKTDFFNEPYHPKLAAAERHHPIWLGGPRERLYQITWRLPSGWSAEPADYQIKNDNPFLRLDCSVRFKDDSIVYRYEFERSGYSLKKEDYSQAQSIDLDRSRCEGLMIYIKPDASANSNQRN